jgi:hypothetical protein
MRIDGPQITSSLTLNGTTITDLNMFATTASLNTLSGSYATTGSNLFKGTQTISGSLIPAVDNTYDLGSITNQFRDLYLSSASLYIDGTKVLSSTTQELQITTDAGQSFKILEAGSDTITLQSGDGNITLASSGGGDVILDPTNGIVALKGTTQVYAGNKVRSSDGNNIVFGDGLTVSGSVTITGFIEAQELRTTYISSSILYRSGSTKFGDELSDTHDFTGSLNISGSINIPGSGLFSGSAQVDVMSTTNIARLATTGSNIFTSNQIVSGSITSTSTITGTNFVTNGTTLYGITLKGRSADNYGAVGFYSTDGATRYGYIQSHSTNGGQLNITADGAGQIIMDNRGVVITSALSGTTATFGSSVTTTNLYLGTLTNEQLMISGTGSRGIGISTTTSGDPFVRLYDNTTIKGDIWWSRSGNYMGINSISNINTAINPNGGNILLGTPTEYGSGFRLQVNGSAYITGIVYSNAGFYINSGQYTGITETPYTGMYMTNSSSSDGFGALLVTSRTDVARPIIFGTSNGSVSVERLRITPAGVLSGTTAAFSSAVTVGGHNVWTAGNDGSGSGLDADLLDGRDSSGYMTQLQGGISFQQGSYTGWYKIARSSQATNGAGLRGGFKVIVAATGNYLTPTQDEITGFKDWTTIAVITSVVGGNSSIFQNYRITYDADFSYLEGYVSYYFGGDQDIYITSLVHGLNGLTWSPMTGLVQASTTSSGAVSIGKVGTGLTVPYFRTSGGIQFGSGTSTLNYYEEGTFTPTSVGTNMSSVSATWGRYVRIGNQVSIQARWEVTPGGTGQKYLVFNLPFAFSITSNIGYTGAVSNYNNGLSSSSSNVGTSVRNSSGSDTQQYVEAVFTSTNTGSMFFAMTYFTF